MFSFQKLKDTHCGPNGDVKKKKKDGALATCEISYSS